MDYMPSRGVDKIAYRVASLQVHILRARQRIAEVSNCIGRLSGRSGERYVLLKKLSSGSEERSTLSEKRLLRPEKLSNREEEPLSSRWTGSTLPEGAFDSLGLVLD